MRQLALLVLLVLFVLLVAPAGLAQEAVPPGEPQVLTLEQARTLALERDVGVLNARGDLEAARRADRRVGADPLALKVARLEAAQAVTAAEETLAAAGLAADLAVMTDYHDALEAEDAATLDETRVELARMALDAASIRLTAGAASQLDVERAANDLAGAERAAAASRRTATLALQRLTARVGAAEAAVALVEPAGSEALPALEEVLARRDGNAGVQAAARALELARARLEAVDNPYSARADMEAARDAVAAAERGLEDARTRLELSLRQAYNLVEAAAGARSTAEDALRAARSEADAQQIRFDAGSIARVELDQARLRREEAAAQARVAGHDLEAALLQLEQAAVGGGL